MGELRIAAILTILLIPGSAIAVGSIQDNDIVFEYISFYDGDGGTSTRAEFLGAGTANDQIYHAWWFYRVGVVPEDGLLAPTSEAYGGRSANLGWTDVGALGLFDAELTVVVFDTGSGGNLFQQLEITNTSLTQGLTIDVFHYIDFDLMGSGNNDSTALDFAAGDIQMTITDGSSSNEAIVIAYGADAYQVTTYSALLDQLTDNSTDDLDNTGLPQIAQDFTGGFQWSSVTIAAGESQTFLTQLAGDSALLPPGAIPEPDAGVLLGLGLVALGVMRRRASRS
jgi:hypothetical protein